MAHRVITLELPEWLLRDIDRWRKGKTVANGTPYTRDDAITVLIRHGFTFDQEANERQKKTRVAVAKRAKTVAAKKAKKRPRSKEDLLK